MSPTVYRESNRRYFFFSREEERMHVHISSPNGEAKFWLEPIVALANFAGYKKSELNDIERIVKENENDFRSKWKQHFGS